MTNSDLTALFLYSTKNLWTKINNLFEAVSVMFLIPGWNWSWTWLPTSYDCDKYTDLAVRGINEQYRGKDGSKIETGKRKRGGSKEWKEEMNREESKTDAAALIHLNEQPHSGSTELWIMQHNWNTTKRHVRRSSISSCNSSLYRSPGAVPTAGNIKEEELWSKQLSKNNIKRYISNNSSHPTTTPS